MRILRQIPVFVITGMIHALYSCDLRRGGFGIRTVIRVGSSSGEDFLPISCGKEVQMIQDKAGKQVISLNDFSLGSTALSGVKLACGHASGRRATGTLQWTDQNICADNPSAPAKSERTTAALSAPFNPVLYSPEMGASFLEFQAAEGKNTTLAERQRQVVILAVGAMWRCACELYAHSAAGRLAGQPDAGEWLGGSAAQFPADRTNRKRVM